MTSRMRFRNIVDTMSCFRLLLQANRSREAHLCKLVASMCFARLPSITLCELLDQIRRPNEETPAHVILHPSLRGGGSGSIGEMAALSAIVATQKPRNIVEIGTYDGCATWHLLNNAHPEVKLITIDLPSGVSVRGSTDIGLQGFKSRPFFPIDGRITLRELDSRQWDPRSDLVNTKCDLCFIDGGHSYECVRNDTEKVLPHMAHGSLIVWHDSTWKNNLYGVNKYLHHISKKLLNIKLLRISPFDFCSLAVCVLE